MGLGEGVFLRPLFPIFRISRVWSAFIGVFLRPLFPIFRISRVWSAFIGVWVTLTPPPPSGGRVKEPCRGGIG